jgi:hypothetical protein
MPINLLSISLVKGKLLERVGCKATGLAAIGSGAANIVIIERKSHSFIERKGFYFKKG